MPVWPANFFEKIGMSMVAGLTVSLFRDISLSNTEGMMTHFYLITFILSIFLILIGALLNKNKLNIP